MTETCRIDFKKSHCIEDGKIEKTKTNCLIPLSFVKKKKIEQIKSENELSLPSKNSFKKATENINPNGEEEKMAPTNRLFPRSLCLTVVPARAKQRWRRLETKRYILLFWGHGRAAGVR